jgi:hypothetical protein
MITFLTSLGIAALVVIVVVVLGLLYLYFRIRRFLRNLAKSALGPETIHLEPASEDWSNANALVAARGFLESHGYDAAGEYVVPEMPGVRVSAFVKPADAAIAVAYEHPDAGFWVDFVQRYADDTSVTVTSAVRGHELDHRPGHDKVYLAGASLDALHERFLTERRAGDPVAVGVNDFASVFETAYAEEIAWRAGRGGVTASEVARVASEMDFDDPAASRTARE